MGDTALHTEGGGFGGHRQHHPPSPANSCLHTPSAGSGAGWPWALAAAGWSGTKVPGVSAFVTETRESGLWSGGLSLPLTKSVGMASLAPSDPTALSSGLPTCGKLMSVFLLFESRVCP